MKAISTPLLLISLAIILFTTPCSADVRVWHQGIQAVNVDLRGAPVVLGQQTIEVTEPGCVLIQFDGTCVVSPGDRIMLAANDDPDWEINDGHTAVEAYDADINRRNFSHSRMYPVTPGIHTFYTVGENYVEYDGNGIASVYASMTVKFYPDLTNDSFVAYQNVSTTGVNVRGAPVVIVEDTVITAWGYVLVRFDGMCYSAPGDNIVLAASDTPNWGSNDGNVVTQALNDDVRMIPFSHARAYNVTPGSHTYYGVAENYVQLDGTGIISIYGGLTIEFIPTSITRSRLMHADIVESYVDVETAPQVLGDVTFTAYLPGTAVVRYEGKCVSNPGDRILLAASDGATWGVNDGHVVAEAAASTLRYTCFSHTRVYEIPIGTYTFNAVAHNYMETAGDGIIHNYATLSVEYFVDPDLADAGDGVLPEAFALRQNHPNPFNPITTISYELERAGRVNLCIYTPLGRRVRTLVDGYQTPGSWQYEWDGRNDLGRRVATGVYLYRLTANGQEETRKMVMMK